MATVNAFSGSGVSCVRGERSVFSGLGFRVESGGVLILTGANGSGKSSLLRLMAGLGRPAAGTLNWDGRDIAEDPTAHRFRTHYVGHSDAVKPVLTVFEQLAFWAGIRGCPSAELASRTRRALSAVGMSHLVDLPGRFLSAGQRRRLNLARLLVTPARLWLLDEPTTALDAEAVGMLQGEIARHRGDGGLVVLSTHGGQRPPRAGTLDLSGFAAGSAARPW
jgi:heme exporter protein A